MDIVQPAVQIPATTHRHVTQGGDGVVGHDPLNGIDRTRGDQLSVQIQPCLLPVIGARHILPDHAGGHPIYSRVANLSATLWLHLRIERTTGGRADQQEALSARFHLSHDTAQAAPVGLIHPGPESQPRPSLDSRQIAQIDVRIAIKAIGPASYAATGPFRV